MDHEMGWDTLLWGDLMGRGGPGALAMKEFTPSRAKEIDVY